MLDPIQNHALRLCLGAIRTSSASLFVLANEPPLYIPRRKLSIQYSLKLSLSTYNPTVFSCKFKDFVHRNTHTHPFNSPFSGTIKVSRYQKGKTNLDFTEARDSEWQWHQLGHVQVCTSLQTDNHASTPQLSFLQAGCPSCHPTNSVKALKEVSTSYTVNKRNSSTGYSNSTRAPSCWFLQYSHPATL